MTCIPAISSCQNKGTELARDRMVSACWTETESPSCCPRCSAGRDPLSRRTPSSKPHVWASRGKCWWMIGWWLFCFFEGGIAIECRVGNYFSSISIRFGMPPWSMDYIQKKQMHIVLPWFRCPDSMSFHVTKVREILVDSCRGWGAWFSGVSGALDMFLIQKTFGQKIMSKFW